jgi:hypothetical protein
VVWGFGKAMDSMITEIKKAFADYGDSRHDLEIDARRTAV